MKALARQGYSRNYHTNFGTELTDTGDAMIGRHTSSLSFTTLKERQRGKRVQSVCIVAPRSARVGDRFSVAWRAPLQGSSFPLRSNAMRRSRGPEAPGATDHGVGRRGWGGAVRSMEKRKASSPRNTVTRTRVPRSPPRIE